MKFFTIFLAVWLGIASAAEAQRNLGIAAASGEKRVALVIGNAAYKDAPLKNPVNDARDMAAALRRLGFDVIERTNVSQKDINRAIAQFGEKLRADTVALFFYAGHGMQVKGKNYIIPIDAHITGEAAVRAEAVDVDTVMDQLAISPMNIVILDACRNNPFERKFRSTSGGLAQMDAPKGSLIAYATAPGKTAADGDSRNGLYTQELLKHIQTPGLPLETVFKRVRNGVMAASGEAQTPWEASSLTGEFFFRPVAGAASATAQHVAVPVDLTAVEVSFWESIKNSTEREDYQAYLDKYPSGQFVALAERRLKKKPVPVAGADGGKTFPGVPGSVFTDCADCPEMVVLPTGIAMGKAEVTQRQWKAVMGNNPSTFKNCGDDCPVETMSWDDTQDFIRRLNAKTGKAYRLPSEAEWASACQAGERHEYCGSDNIDSVAWYSRNSDNKTHRVASKQPNAWGLYDMSGNVWEWMQDCWEGNCGQRAKRSGSFGGRPADTLSLVRYGESTTAQSHLTGFRLARTLRQESTQQIDAAQRVEARPQWAESDNGADINWAEAKNYCASKGSGWRLPSVAELLNSYSSGQSTPCDTWTKCKVASKSLLTGSAFWSNEQKNSRQAWYVSLHYGHRDAHSVEYGFGFRALCVRSP